MTGPPEKPAEGESLTVRFDRTPEEGEKLLRMRADGEGCVQLALASISGRTLGDVFRTIGNRPTGQDQWWKVHAERLGLRLVRATAAPDGTAPDYDTIDDLHALPDGRYLVDSDIHLAALVMGPGYVADCPYFDERRTRRTGGRIPEKVLNVLVPVDALRRAYNGWDPASGDPLPMEVYSVERNTFHRSAPARERT